MRVAAGELEPEKWIPGKTILFNARHPYDCRAGLLYTVSPGDEPILKVVYGSRNHLSSNGYQRDLERLGWVEIGMNEFPIESLSHRQP